MERLNRKNLVRRGGRGEEDGGDKTDENDVSTWSQNIGLGREDEDKNEPQDERTMIS